MNRAWWIGAGLIAVALTVSSVALAADPTPDPAVPEGVAGCLECHGRPGQEMTRDGQRVSIYVNPQEYQESVHGIISCVRCHGEATAEHAANPEQPLGLPRGRELRKEMSDRCVKCHAGLYERSYNESFHGVATRNGDLRGATCVDCHGVHNVFPSNDPRSTVAPAAIPQTCGQSGCHVNPPASWADRTEHFITMDRQSGGINWLVWKFFVALILFDVMKDGPIVMFDLLRRLRS